MRSDLLWRLATVALGVLAFSGVAAAQPGGLTTRQVRLHGQAGFGNFHAVGQPIRPGGVDRQSRHRGSGYGYGALGGWESGVYEDPEALRDAGFFAGSADARVEGGRVHYDYDRGYPYDWYRDARGEGVQASSFTPNRPATIRCEVEAAGIRVCRGGR